MDVVVWLRSLGLGKYEAAFRENEIDESVPPSLTHETLKEFDVAAVDRRLRLLDAAAAPRNDASLKPQSVDAATPSSTPSPHPEDRAEPPSHGDCLRPGGLNWGSEDLRKKK